MTWVSLILALLQVASGLLSWMKSRQALQQGEDEAIAKATAAILVQTVASKKIMADIMGMTDTQVDEALKKLEP